MAKTPADRFETAREFAEALARADVHSTGPPTSLDNTAGTTPTERPRHPVLRLRALGSPSVEGRKGHLSGAAAQPKSLALLALLAAAGPRGVSRDKILAYLWPETESDKASHRLSQVLHALRRDLGAEELFLGTSNLSLNPQVISTDNGDFTDALDRCDLEGAVSLYGGPFLDGFFLNGAPEFERWVDGERAQYHKRFDAAVESLATAAAQRNDWRGSAEWWRRLAEGDPLNSRVAVHYLDALSAAGDRAGALEFARVHERLVRAELQTAPDPAVMAAIERMRSQPASVTPSATPSPTGPAAAPVTSIAVLPFVNLSTDPNDEYFSEGMTEELINALVQVAGLRVASRTASFAFRQKDADLREIGDRLKVGTVVEGSVRKAGSRVRITAQLVTVADGYSLWGETYERTLADVFVVQEELARAIVAALSLKLPGTAAGAIVKPSTASLEAYTLYLRGRYFRAKQTAEALRMSVKYLEEAIREDPGYARAYAGLADSYSMLALDEYGGMPPLEAIPKAKAAAVQSLKIDKALGEAHGALAVIAMLYEWDWGFAEREFKQAASLEPASSYSSVWYAMFLGAMGRHNESIPAILGAQALQPASHIVQMCVGRCYYWARRHDEAITQFRATLEMEPGLPLTYVWIARAYCGKGLFREALIELEKGMRVERNPLLLMVSGYANAALGLRDQVREILMELRNEARRRYVSPTYEAWINCALGDKDEAFRQLDLAYEQRSSYLAWLRVEPMYDSLRSDPRFVSMLERTRLDF